MPSSSILPIIGLPQFDGWSQVVEDRHDEVLFVCSFAIAGEHAGNIGRDLVTMLEANPPRKPRIFYQQLQAMVEHCASNAAKLYLAAGLFGSEGCYLASYRGGVWLKRGEKLGVVMVGDDELKMIEGEQKSDDVFVFYTQEAQEFLDELELKLGQGYDAVTAATSIVPSVQREDAAATAALAVVYQPEAEMPEAESFRIKRLQSRPASAAAATSNLEPSVANNQIDLQPVDQLSTSQSSNIIARRDSKKIKIKLPKPSFAFVSNLRRFLSKKTESQSAAMTPEPSKSRFGPLTLRKFKLASGWFEPRRFLAWLILIMIFVGLTWGVWSLRQRSQARQATLNSLGPILADLESARALANQDPVAARQQVDSISARLSALRAETKAEVSLNLIDEAQAKTASLAKEVSGLEEVSALPQFYDLRLAKPEFIASRAVGSNDQAIFLDAQQKQLLILNLNSKSVEAVEIPADFTPQDITLVEDQVFLLGSGIHKLVETDGQFSWEEVIQAADENQTATKIAAFGQNLYVINPEKRAIYRYTPSENGYNEPTNWLTTPLDFDFNLITGLAIDGDLWLTNQRGEIKRYASGKEQTFTIEGLEQPLAGSLQIVTSANLDEIYVLEPSQHRLLVFDKQGQFVRQVDSSSLSAAALLFVSQSKNSIYVVSGSVIYQLDL